jgi:hypothetical protein
VGSVGRNEAGVDVGVGEGDRGLGDAVCVGVGESVMAGEGVVGALVAGDTDADVAGGADSGGAGFGAGVAFGTTELGAVELAGELETIGAAGPAVRDVAVDDGLTDGAWLLAGADVPRISERASRLRAKTTTATPANATRT